MAKSYNHRRNNDRLFNDGAVQFTAEKKKKNPKKIRNCAPDEAIDLFESNSESAPFTFEKIHSPW